MVCTTDFNKIPEKLHPTTQTNKPNTEPVDDPLFKVYEMENGWRSFRWSQVKAINKQEVIHVNKETEPTTNSSQGQASTEQK